MLILCLSFALAALDQATKHLIRMRFLPGEQVPVVPGLFDITYVRNTGAAWGILSGLNHWLILLSVFMLGALTLFRRSLVADTRIHRVATSLLIAGILGNLLDRVRLGYVVDFLDFYLGSAHFPAFNVADAAICTGMGLYALTQLCVRRPDSQEAGDAPTPGV